MGFEKWQDAETFTTQIAKEWIDNHPQQAIVLERESNLKNSNKALP